MHRAVCADCGKDCEVPFRPSGDKPVFCSECFSTKEGSTNNRAERRDSSRSGSRDKQMFKAVCSECGKDCEVPFRPTGDKPVFCSDCFGKGEKRGDSSNSSDKYKEQFEMMNSKLDNILKMLSTSVPSEKIVKKEKPVIEVSKKVVEKKNKDKKVIAPKKVLVVKKSTKKAPAAKKTAKKVAVLKKAKKKAVAKKNK